MKLELASYDPQRRYLIGVSGGKDSVTLLQLLLSLGYRRLVVCHLDHQLRGRSSRADAAFVEKLAIQSRLQFTIGSTDVASMAKEKRLSIETAAREARYEFFARAARKWKCHTLFLAHHADDQVETFLFNLFRGTGTSGLGAMRVNSTREIGGVRLQIARPMLGVWREEIDDYAETHRLKYREDATNGDTAHRRNAMRHQIIPALEKWFGREIKISAWRSAAILGEENTWLDSLIKPPASELSVAELRKMHVAEQRRVIHAWLKLMQVNNTGFTEVESIRSLLPELAATAKMNLPGGRHARRRAGKIFVE